VNPYRSAANDGKGETVSAGTPRQLGLDFGDPAAQPAPGGPDVFSIGHSNRSLATFLALLRRHDIAALADVRSVPYSRRHPHFNRESLGHALAAAGIAYSHWPELGGKRAPSADAPLAAGSALFRGYAEYAATPPFAAALARLDAAARVKRLAFMCAEAKPENCHRRFIADALERGGRRVGHILDDTPMSDDSR
jgi:uncharacterized protein (DUF488 family)